ncbi:hypothetical protein BT69DRAFT_1334633 [Atractiella rhizophila]|nr:hypothetical protein BT69DRAFT_1334633 [Atractiella rhizophila]
MSGGGHRGFPEQVQKTWTASLHWDKRPQNSSTDLPSWKIMKHWIRSLDIPPFGSGLSPLHLCHDLADLGFYQQAEINDLATLMSSPNNTTPGSRDMLRQLLPEGLNVDLGDLFTFIVQYLRSENGLSPKVRTWFEPSPANVEHLLCKVHWFQTKIDVIEAPGWDGKAIEDSFPWYMNKI